MTSPPVLIGPAQAALIGGRVSIIVGSRDAAMRPHVMRAAGCRLSADWRRATVLMPLPSSEQVLADLRANGQIAVVFSEPSTHRTLQLKGGDAGVAACGPDDAALAAATLRGFIAELGGLGYGEPVARSILAEGSPLMAVHFTIAAAFEQTPGPAAGEPLAAPPAR